MNRIAVARELTQVARLLSAGDSSLKDEFQKLKGELDVMTERFRGLIVVAKREKNAFAVNGMKNCVDGLKEMKRKLPDYLRGDP